LPLDVPAVEIHGAPGSPTSTNWAIQNLTSTQITTPTLPKSNHYITANTAIDGGGTVLTSFSVKAYIISADAVSVTIRFTNTTAATAYLANNGDQVPFLQLWGYAVRTTDGYTSVSDSSSINIRGERSLDTTLEWVQDRTTASDMASRMLGTLARPRPELKMTVAGDPRRKPGQLITVLDAEQTGADGSWRILSVGHNTLGPSYTQDLHVVRVLPAAVWDGLDGWDEGSWS